MPRENDQLEDLRFSWNRLGELDPYWAVLSHRDKQGNRWDPEEFFATGREEIDGVMRTLGHLELDVPRRRALDFGCGVGRLSQALAQHFETVEGVDISPSMLRLAEEHNRAGERCRYHLNERRDLSLFEDGRFDFIYSNITLQHIPPKLSKRYLREFLRVTAPGGVLVFQLAERHRFIAHARTPLGRALGALRWWSWLVAHQLYLWWHVKLRGEPQMDIHGVRRSEVERIVQHAGATLVDVQQDDSAGPDWTSARYFVSKPDLLPKR